MRLYGTTASPFVARVRIQGAAKGLHLELISPPGGLGSPAMRALSPIGRVPILDAEGELIPESGVILEYLEDRFPTPPLRGRTALEAARVRLVSRVVDLYLVPALQPLRAALATPDAVDLQASERSLRDALTYVDACMSGGEFAVGEALSLADCAFAPVYLYVSKLTARLLPQLALTDWPRLYACAAGSAKHAAVAPVLASIETALSQARAGVKS